MIKGQHITAQTVHNTMVQVPGSVRNLFTPEQLALLNAQELLATATLTKHLEHQKIFQAQQRTKAAAGVRTPDNSGRGLSHSHFSAFHHNDNGTKPNQSHAKNTSKPPVAKPQPFGG